MATAVDLPVQLPVQMVVVAPPSTDQDKLMKLKKQNAFLAYTVTRKMLHAENLNGFHHRQDNRFTHEVINEPGFKGAVETLEKACQYLTKEKMGEMERLVGTLDITDSQLCVNFQNVSDHLMQDDIRFGRIGSLFFFTFVLCKRLYTEGRQKEVDSVIDWLTRFLNERIAPWLIKNHLGQWAAIRDGIRVDPPPPTTGPRPKVGSGWVTMAALGVGAFVVGALAIR